MKKIVALALFLFAGIQLMKAQLGSTRDQIVSRFGLNFYKTGISNEEEPYIIYKTQDSSAASGQYTKMIGFYFTESEDGTSYCNEQLIMEPLTEMNNWLEFYKSKYEEIGKGKFRDSKNKVMFKVSEVNRLCAVRMWYE